MPASAPVVRDPVVSTALGLTFERVGRDFTAGDGERRSVLRELTFNVAPHEIVAILGPSGCGKSTLLRIAAGLDVTSAGTVRIDGTPVREYDARCAFAFQEPRLLPWRSIIGNIALGLPPTAPAEAGRRTVTQLLELVGLTEFADHRPREVSGGMAQRTSLARALARTPGVLLLDEPFGALDALTRLRMQDLLLDVHAATPATVLLVTHDVDEALYLADRVLLLGADGDAPGAAISQTLTVPGERPRDRGSAHLAELRARLLRGLGVESTHIIRIDQESDT